MTFEMKKLSSSPKDLSLLCEYPRCKVKAMVFFGNYQVCMKHCGLASRKLHIINE